MQPNGPTVIIVSESMSGHTKADPLVPITSRQRTDVNQQQGAAAFLDVTFSNPRHGAPRGQNLYNCAPHRTLKVFNLKICSLTKPFSGVEIHLDPLMSGKI